MEDDHQGDDSAQNIGARLFGLAAMRERAELPWGKLTMRAQAGSAGGLRQNCRAVGPERKDGGTRVI